MKTTISIDIGTRNKLKEVGKKGETYDEIIQRLIKNDMSGYKVINIMDVYTEAVKKCEKLLKRLINGDANPNELYLAICPKCGESDWNLGTRIENQEYSTKNKSKIYLPVDKNDPDTIMVAYDEVKFLKCMSCAFEVQQHDKKIVKEKDKGD